MKPKRIEIEGMLPKDPATLKELAAHIIETSKYFPRGWEATTMVLGVECFIACEVVDDCIEVFLAPRDVAEKVLNEHGLRIRPHPAYALLATKGADKKH